MRAVSGGQNRNRMISDNSHFINLIAICGTTVAWPARPLSGGSWHLPNRRCHLPNRWHGATFGSPAKPLRLLNQRSAPERSANCSIRSHEQGDSERRSALDGDTCVRRYVLDNFKQESTVRYGAVEARLTRVTVYTRPVGRAELVIAERPLS